MKVLISSDGETLAITVESLDEIQQINNWAKKNLVPNADFVVCGTLNVKNEAKRKDMKRTLDQLTFLEINMLSKLVDSTDLRDIVSSILNQDISVIKYLTDIGVDTTPTSVILEIIN